MTETLIPSTYLDTLAAKNIADMLDKKYPGHLWGVHVQGGVAQIMNLRLSGRWGFVVHLDQIDTEYHAVMRAGGELLERYALSRGRFKSNEYNALDTNSLGELLCQR